MIKMRLIGIITGAFLFCMVLSMSVDGSRFPNAIEKKIVREKVGYYSFSSPFISEKLDLNGSWTQLLRRLMRKSGWNSNRSQQFQLCFTSLERIELCVLVLSAKDYTNNIERNGYRVVIEAHINNV